MTQEEAGRDWAASRLARGYTIPELLASLRTSTASHGARPRTNPFHDAARAYLEAEAAK